MPTQDFQLVTDEFRIEIETKILQGTSWDRRHCAQGGTDSAGRSWGCRNLGVRHIGGEWLCAHCADEVPDPTEVTHLSCPDCRPTGLLTRPTAPGQYYWCNTCHEEWRTDGPDHTRPPIGDILFIITWLAYSMGLFFLLMLTAGIWLRDHTNVNHDTLRGARRSTPRRSMMTNCPRCDSPAPNLHPAVQHEGEVETCYHEFHGDYRPQPGESLAQFSRRIYPRTYFHANFTAKD